MGRCVEGPGSSRHGDAGGDVGTQRGDGEEGRGDT